MTAAVETESESESESETSLAVETESESETAVTRETEPESETSAVAETESEAETATLRETEPETETELQSEETELSEAGIALLSEDTPDKFKLIVNNTIYFAPASLKSGNAATTYKTIQWQDGSDSVTRTAYCIQPKLNSPGSGHTYKEDDAVELDASNGMAKGMYYLYGGPMWGKKVTYADGSGSVNAETGSDGCGMLVDRTLLHDDPLYPFLYLYERQQLEREQRGEQRIECFRRCTGQKSGWHTGKSWMSRRHIYLRQR